jgi:hypothetical protein
VFNELATLFIAVDNELIPSRPCTLKRPRAPSVDILLRPPKTETELRPGPRKDESEERPSVTDCVDRPEIVVESDERPWGLCRPTK